MTHAVDDITRVVCDVTLISGKTVICVLSCVCAHLCVDVCVLMCVCSHVCVLIYCVTCLMPSMT